MMQISVRIRSWWSSSDGFKKSKNQEHRKGCLRSFSSKHSYFRQWQGGGQGRHKGFAQTDRVRGQLSQQKWVSWLPVQGPRVLSAVPLCLLFTNSRHGQEGVSNIKQHHRLKESWRILEALREHSCQNDHGRDYRDTFICLFNMHVFSPYYAPVTVLVCGKVGQK